MQRARARWLLRVAIVVVGGLALGWWFVRSHSENVLTIENRSGQPIATLRVTLGDDTATFQNVASGSELTRPILPGAEVPFAVAGKLADGTEFKMAGGQVREPTTVVVLPGGNVQLQPRRKSGPF